MARIAKLEPHPVDRHVGARIRARRRLMGISQAQLAEALGLTFQQVQKYERGANRVSSSKLYEIAQKLNTPLAAFFDGLDHRDGDARASGDMVDFMGETGSQELARAFKSMSPRLRTGLVDLAKAMASSAD